MPGERPLLLVDDSPDDLILLRRLLQKANVRTPIVTAENGRAAQKLLQGGFSDPAALPQAVFTDIQMPDVDGLSLVRWARSNRQLDKVKFVLLTSDLAAAESRTAQSVGANACFQKFPPASMLLKFVEKL